METVSFTRRLFGLLSLAAIQILILNRIELFGYVTPLFYIWMIARFDNSMSRTAQLLWAFFLGLLIDTFGGTPGLNAATATLLAMIQPSLLKLFVTIDRHDVVVPGIATMGGSQFAGYILLVTFIHHSVYYILRSIPLGDWTVVFLKIVLSTVFTFILMLIAESLTTNKSRKR